MRKELTFGKRTRLTLETLRKCRAEKMWKCSRWTERVWPSNYGGQRGLKAANVQQHHFVRQSAGGQGAPSPSHGEFEPWIVGQEKYPREQNAE